MGIFSKTKIAVVAVLLIFFTAGFVRAEYYCPPQDPPGPTPDVKWLQPPDVTPKGMDVKATLPKVLADDFLCTQTGPITDIRIWGSWLRDKLPPRGAGQVTFGLGIFSDIPAGPGPRSYSRPGELLWGQIFRPGDFEVSLFKTVRAEGWYNPDGNYIFPADRKIWQYDFQIDPAEAFVQEGDLEEPMVYWLGVTALVRPPQGDVGGQSDGNRCTPPQFGWKTSSRHWNDDAVWAEVDFRNLDGLTDGVGVPEADGLYWNELRYPSGHPYAGRSIDLSFALVPEPTCLALLALGIIPLFIRGRKAQR
ncbi:MAG: hypothetical protein GWP14_00075 [Actinobacteria bacterium]|nr:hypothetical protein [Actinomycetota bacterium]